MKCKPIAQAYHSELLCYIVYAQGCGSVQCIKDIIVEKFSEDDVIQAKDTIYQLRKDILGAMPVRRKVRGNSAIEANVNDILSAMVRVDEANAMPTFVAINLQNLPKLMPEEMNAISLAERVSALESRMGMLEGRVASDCAGKSSLPSPTRSPAPVFANVTPTVSPSPAMRLPRYSQIATAEEATNVKAAVSPSRCHISVLNDESSPASYSSRQTVPDETADRSDTSSTSPSYSKVANPEAITHVKVVQPSLRITLCLPTLNVK